jgi:hypothetical protein
MILLTNNYCIYVPIYLSSCTAQVSEEAFAPYYSAFMPGIKSILRAAIAPEQAILRGKVSGKGEERTHTRTHAHTYTHSDCVMRRMYYKYCIL